MPKSTRRTIPLSATERRNGKYGTEQLTITPNTGAILTSYMLERAISSIKKLAEEVPVLPPLTEKERADKARSDILSEVFDQFVKENEENEKSAFSFVNEARETQQVTENLSLSFK